MSTKDKLLSSAQKNILKGQIDRAIKEYEQIVTLDPDIRHRQKLAELLVKASRRAEAVEEYAKIGDFYAGNGFYLKSIAVYKQIQRLDPSNIVVSLTLGSLNEKQGLKGNALAEYKTAVDFYEREGNYGEAASILEKMLAVDPSNINIQQKLAETFFLAGNGEKAYQIYRNVALMLRERGDRGGFDRLCARIQKLFPTRREFLLDLFSARIASGEAAATIPPLKELIKKDSKNILLWNLLTDAFRAAGNLSARKAAFQKMTQLFPDDIVPIEGLIRCCIQEEALDEGLELAASNLKLFVARKEAGRLEECLRAFNDLNPDDLRVLNALRDLYEATGEETKLSDVAARLAFVVGYVKQEEPDEPLWETAQAADPSPAVPDEAPWEEEIDLSLADDNFVEPGAGDASGYLSEPASLADDPFLRASDEWPSPDENDSVELPAAEPSAPAMEEFSISADFSFLDDEAPVSAHAPVAPTAGETAAQPVSKYSFDGLFSEFKKGLDKQVDREDTETHYNLGIAYKEMGLYSDAISEFETASADPRRRTDCITLQGICYREKGDFDQAEEVLKKGAAAKGLSEAEKTSLSYELGLLYELTGKADDAVRSYVEAYRLAPGFRDTLAKINLLREESGVDLSDFDGLEQAKA